MKPAPATLIVAPRAEALDVVRQCQEPGIGRVWIHGTLQGHSVSAHAVAFCRQHGIRIIAGACPVTFSQGADRGARRALSA